MTSTRIHAFGDDALGDHDAVALAGLIRRGELGIREVTGAAIARAGKVAELNAVVVDRYDESVSGADADAPLYGVPTFVKDNTDIAGLPTNHGTSAYRAKPAAADGPYARQLLATGLTVLGKSALPEYGFNASTEFADRPPTRNPWHTGYSVGASSGGAAALVASGVVPIAHANDGGGSIRIPAACAGLVGLKPSRGRHANGPQARLMPINLISEGVLTRTVRDTAAYLAAVERHAFNPKLPVIGTIDVPSTRRLRIGVLTDGIAGRTVDQDTRATVEATADLLAEAGHFVEPAALPLTEDFARRVRPVLVDARLSRRQHRKTDRPVLRLAQTRRASRWACAADSCANAGSCPKRSTTCARARGPTSACSAGTTWCSAPFSGTPRRASVT